MHVRVHIACILVCERGRVRHAACASEACMNACGRGPVRHVAVKVCPGYPHNLPAVRIS